MRRFRYRKRTARPPHHKHDPELNPVETLWQFMRDNWLSHRVFASDNDIVDRCCGA